MFHIKLETSLCLTLYCDDTIHRIYCQWIWSVRTEEVENLIAQATETQTLYLLRYGREQEKEGVVRIKNLNLNILRVRWILNIQEAISVMQSEGQANCIHIELFGAELVLKAKG